MGRGRNFGHIHVRMGRRGFGGVGCFPFLTIMLVVFLVTTTLNNQPDNGPPDEHAVYAEESAAARDPWSPMLIVSGLLLGLLVLFTWRKIAQAREQTRRAEEARLTREARNAPLEGHGVFVDDEDND